MNILDRLEQTEIWYGQDERPYRISEMEQRHRINALAWLRDRAQSFYDHKLWVESRMLRNAPEEVLDAWDRSIEQDPLQWLNAQPVVQAIEKAIRDHDTVDGEVVTAHRELPGRNLELPGRTLWITR